MSATGARGFQWVDGEFASSTLNLNGMPVGGASLDSTRSDKPYRGRVTMGNVVTTFRGTTLESVRAHVEKRVREKVELLMDGLEAERLAATELQKGEQS